MNKLLFLFTFLLFVSPVFGQYSVCECCMYASFRYEEHFENTFNPETIKNNKIRELTIFSTSKRISEDSKNTTFETVEEEHKKMILKFNASGFVESSISFNDVGQYLSIQEFKRDRSNKILSKTFHYLDSLGNKDEKIFSDKWDYTYSNGRLKQMKKSDDILSAQPDSTSNFERYEYDSYGRIITETRNMYFMGSHGIFYQTKTKYNDSAKSSVAVTRNKDGIFSIARTTYNSDKKPLAIKLIDGRDNKPLEEKIFTYTNNGRLLKIEVKNSTLRPECPDAGNFSDTYFYSSLNLIESINHRYQNVVCSLRFVYR